MTMLQRTAPTTPAGVALTETELQILNAIVKPLPRETFVPVPTLADSLQKLARLGGYLDRANDPPPGNLVIWRGLSRLTNLHLGFLLGAKLVGN